MVGGARDGRGGVMTLRKGEGKEITRHRMEQRNITKNYDGTGGRTV